MHNIRRILSVDYICAAYKYPKPGIFKKIMVYLVSQVVYFDKKNLILEKKCLIRGENVI